MRDEAAAAGACAQTAPVLNTHAAARAAVRVNIFRDRKNGQQSRIHFFLLVWSATERTGTNPCQVGLGLKLIPLPAGLYECIANFKV